MPKLEYITLYTCILYIIYGYNVFYLFNILFNNVHIYFTRSIFINIIVVVAKGKVLLPDAYKIFFILTSSFLY